MPTPQAYE
jgi:NADPH-dependent curcumin reductase CurA